MTVNGESCRAVEINGKVYHSVQEMIERIVELEEENADLQQKWLEESYEKAKEVSNGRKD